MQKNKVLNIYRKGLICFGLLIGVSTVQAEVLVILPETGDLARAGLSIRQGMQSANQMAGDKTSLKFVNANDNNLAALLKKHVNKKTEMVIGPLARQDVERLIEYNPKLPVLALNEVARIHKNVWQFSLSKDADTEALLREIEKDNLSTLYVYQQSGTEQTFNMFVTSLQQKFKGQIERVDQLPKKTSKKSGILLLGDNSWINTLKKLPTKHIYASAKAIADNQPIPVGLKFCDVPAIYVAKWPDVMQAYQQDPTSMPYQRLIAFGGDAWAMSQVILSEPKLKHFSFSGRTGEITMTDQQIQRTPACFINTKKGLVVL